MQSSSLSSYVSHLPSNLHELQGADEKDQLHAPLVEAFAKQGYHILCEKPMATTIDECVEMVKQVQASEEKKIFGVGHGASSLAFCESY
jgi:uncharacterized protein (DUF1810 family)